MPASDPKPRFADQALADFLSAARPLTGATPSVAELRAGVEQRAATKAPGPAMDTVCDVDAGGVPARLYRPQAGPLGLIVYLHSGGWTIGSLASFDRVSRRLADRAGAAVLTVDYRLAPEHPWPAAVDDTVAALRWVAAAPAELGALTGRTAVAGDSAGGTLAGLACLRLREEAPDALPDLQALIYANTDLTGAHPSMREKATGFGLDADDVRAFNRHWVPDPARWGDPGVSPLHATELRGLPPALIVTAEHDPLRDEGEAYAERLREAGIAVTARREPGMIHAFLLMDAVSPACAAAADRVADDLGRALVPDRPLGP